MSAAGHRPATTPAPQYRSTLQNSGHPALRVAIFTTHPIQYQAPWFCALAEDGDLVVRVFFSYIPDEQEQGIGFGTTFAWDIPLRDGYDNVVLSTHLLPTPVPAFFRRKA